jgi:hypothetical protein
MFVITIDGIDRSYHSLSVDADEQKTRFEEAGSTNVLIVEKDTFEPVNPE